MLFSNNNIQVPFSNAKHKLIDDVSHGVWTKIIDYKTLNTLDTWIYFGNSVKCNWLLVLGWKEKKERKKRNL